MSATSNGTSKRLELAAFLRDRRARIAPSEVGLPDGPRRRTPGLRREEVAQLAEVGASWYTWLEQGRDIHVSEAFLERLSRALRLEPAERAHLFGLAQGRSPRGVVTLTDEVSERLQHVVDAHPHPVVVSTTLGDVIAMNEPARILWGDRRGTNSLWTAFTQYGTSCGTQEWERHARTMVARFRVEAARAADRVPFDQLAEELSEISAEFRAMWASQDIAAEPEGAKIVRHDEVGEIALDHVALMHVEPDGRTLRVTFYSPKSGESAERAAKLFAR
jgi:transcriptional regulator with XRE-family HTH domain